MKEVGVGMRFPSAGRVVRETGRCGAIIPSDRVQQLSEPCAEMVLTRRSRPRVDRKEAKSGACRVGRDMHGRARGTESICDGRDYMRRPRGQSKVRGS